MSSINNIDLNTIENTVTVVSIDQDNYQPSRKNFTEEEDEQLCRSYLFVALDAVHGTEQKGETFWSRIKEHFDESIGENAIERAARSLPARWQIINKAVGKYAGILSQVERSNASGSNDESNESKAKKIYKAEVKSSFNLLHCFRILARHPKWQEYQDGKSKKTKRSRTTTVSREDDEEISGLSVRSVGRKASKANASTKRKSDDALEKIIANQEEMLRRGAERAQIMKAALRTAERMARAAEHKAYVQQTLAEATIMASDLSAVSDPTRRMYLQNMQQKIMSKELWSTPENDFACDSDDEEDKDKEESENEGDQFL